jgi:hypothetical protein
MLSQKMPAVHIVPSTHSATVTSTHTVTHPTSLCWEIRCSPGHMKLMHAGRWGVCQGELLEPPSCGQLPRWTQDEGQLAAWLVEGAWDRQARD